MSAKFKPAVERKQRPDGLVQVGTSLTPEVLSILEAEAIREFRTISQHVRKILTEWVEREGG